MKIYKVKGCDSLDKWDFDQFKKEVPDADLLVYYYENGGYDGSGMAIWRKGRKYGYAYLGHCSCDGPMEGVGMGDKMLVTLTQLRKLAAGKDWDWSRYGVKALARLEEVLKGEK